MTNPLNRRRLGWCGLPLLAGLGAALLLAMAMALAGAPASAAAPEAPSATVFYPGCGATIQSCIDTAAAGSTIVISANKYITSLTLNRAVNLTGVSSATVVLQALTNHRVLTVTDAALTSSVVISGLTFQLGHAVGGSCPSGCGGGIYLDMGIEPQLKNLRLLTNTADAGAGGIYAYSAITLTNVDFISNTAGGNGGGLSAGANLIMAGGVVQRNQCTQAGCKGGGVYATANATLTGTQFLSNTSVSDGGGLVVAIAANVSAGRFQSNQCSDVGCLGGGLAVYATLTLNGTQFVSNTSQAGGGGLSFLTGGLTGALFNNNACQAASCQGGAARAGASAQLTATTFLTNAGYGSGGGLYSQGRLTATASVFQGNQCLGAPCQGGAVYGGNSVALTNTQFLSNSAQSNGGGVYATDKADLSGGLWRGNQCFTAACRGGGVYALANLTLSDTTFLSNTSSGGGAGATSVGLATLTGGLFQGNQCVQIVCFGGGLDAESFVTLTGTQFLSNTTQGSGGGLSAINTAVLHGGLFGGNRCLGTGCGGGGLNASAAFVLSGTLFLNNTAVTRGGAVQHATGTGRVVNSLFAGNTAAHGGGALALNSSGSVVVLHATFANGTGAAIELTNGSLGITNSIVASYTIGISRTAGAALESHNLFFGNGNDLIGTITLGGGDVTNTDPQFVSPAAGNYHLQRTSPARNIGVDAGVTNDIDGDTRPANGGFDAGFDEAVNHAPTAGPASYSTPFDTALHVAAPGLVAHGSDADADPLTAVAASAPLSGSLALSASGAFTYTPLLHFSGLITFTYVLTDGLALSAPALVTITVAEANPYKLWLPLTVKAP